MPFVEGLNFRSTAGYVTDGTDETYVLDTDTYPTTRAGVTFGWESGSPFDLDRDSGNDRRLAGCHACFSTAPETFRVDLPNTGTYDIYLACGDAASDQAAQDWKVKDSTTQLFTITANPGSNEFVDATNTVRTAAAWPGSNVANQQTFASTIFRIETNSLVGSNVLAHIQLTEIVVGGQPASKRTGGVQFAHRIRGPQHAMAW